MFQSILVGVSSIEHSEHAIVTGLELARQDLAGQDLAGKGGARIQLVHAVPVPVPLWPRGDPARLAAVNAAALEAARQRLTEPLRELLTSCGAQAGVDDLLHVLPGDAARVLLDRAREVDADLVVLGTHEKRKLIDFGSTARAVLAKASCAVLVQPTSFRPFRRILVPVDLSEGSLRALERARALAEERDATVVCLHCFTTPEFNYAAGMSHPVAEPASLVEQAREGTRAEFERVMGAFDWRGVQHEQQFVEGTPAQAVLEREHDVDLIVMGSHGRTGLAAAVLGSVAYAVLKHAEVAVLAMRTPDREWLA